MKIGTDRSVTILRWTALIVVGMKRQKYALFSIPPCFKYNAPVKSTPVISKGRFRVLPLVVAVILVGYMHVHLTSYKVNIY